MRGNVLMACTALALLAAPVATSHHAAVEARPWDLIDCTYVWGQVVAEAGAVRAHLPPGFEPRIAGSFPDGTQSVLLNVEADDCASGAGLHGPVAGMQYAHVSTAVDVPPELEDPSYPGGTFYSFIMLAPDADRRAFLQAHGVNAVDGSVTLVDAASPTGHVARSAVVQYDGFGTFTVTLTAPLAPLNIGGHFTVFRAAGDDHVARFRTAWQTETLHQGRAVVTATPDNWVAGAMRTSTGTSPTFITGEWTYAPGEMRVPMAYGS